MGWRQCISGCWTASVGAVWQSLLETGFASRLRSRYFAQYSHDLTRWLSTLHNRTINLPCSTTSIKLESPSQPKSLAAIAWRHRLSYVCCCAEKLSTIESLIENLQEVRTNLTQFDVCQSPLLFASSLRILLFAIRKVVTPTCSENSLSRLTTWSLFQLFHCHPPGVKWGFPGFL
jgi:hypothetical protein